MAEPTRDEALVERLRAEAAQLRNSGRFLEDLEKFAQAKRFDEAANRITALSEQVARLEGENVKLCEWKDAIIGLCRAIGSDALEWGGDKTGWGFIHYFVKHLHTRAEAAEAQVAKLTDRLNAGLAACDQFYGPASESDWINGQDTAAQQIRAALTPRVDEPEWTCLLCKAPMGACKHTRDEPPQAQGTVAREAGLDAATIVKCIETVELVHGQWGLSAAMNEAIARLRTLQKPTREGM